MKKNDAAKYFCYFHYFQVVQIFRLEIPEKFDNDIAPEAEGTFPLFFLDVFILTNINETNLMIFLYADSKSFGHEKFRVMLARPRACAKRFFRLGR